MPQPRAKAACSPASTRWPRPHRRSWPGTRAQRVADKGWLPQGPGQASRKQGGQQGPSDGLEPWGTCGARPVPPSLGGAAPPSWARQEAAPRRPAASTRPMVPGAAWPSCCCCEPRTPGRSGGDAWPREVQSFLPAKKPVQPWPGQPPPPPEPGGCPLDPSGIPGTASARKRPSRGRWLGRQRARHLSLRGGFASVAATRKIFPGFVREQGEASGIPLTKQ